jgi:glycosyltransferase involved in cell wall biosynthesis
MRASIVIAAHNEGDLLARTIASCLETIGGLEAEIVVADDASSDGSVEKVARRFPLVRTFGHRRRRGTSSTKDLGARKARGEVLVFLDAHCNPEPWALERLVNDVENFDGTVVVTPQVPNLDPATWRNRDNQVGFGYGLDLERLEPDWLELHQMRRREGYYESPALCGCCFAVSRDLYFKLRGFDRNMVDWGVEDLDFGLKAWFVGEGILHDPHAVIGHRFRTDFAQYSVRDEAITINQLRLGRKHLGDRAWEEWLPSFRARLSDAEWRAAWAGFSRRRRSAERERRWLLAERKRDEYWYAFRFALSWPSI